MLDFILKREDEIGILLTLKYMSTNVTIHPHIASHKIKGKKVKIKRVKKFLRS